MKPRETAPQKAAAPAKPQAVGIKRGRLDHNVIAGVAWMVLGGILFTTMTAVIKHLGTTLPTSIIVFFRMAVGLAIVVPIALVAVGPAALMTAYPGRHALRSFFGAAALACIVYAVSALPFAVATALGFTTPLWIVILAAIFLRERPSALALWATAIGFCGVLVVARPTIVFDPAIVVALAGALLAAAALTMVRALSVNDRSLTIVVWFSFYSALFSVVPALIDWTTPSLDEALLLGATGVLGVGGLFCSAQAYRLAKAATVAPVDFIRLPLAAVIGIVVFAEIPDLATIAGTLLILAALVLIVADRK